MSDVVKIQKWSYLHKGIHYDIVNQLDTYQWSYYVSQLGLPVTDLKFSGTALTLNEARTSCIDRIDATLEAMGAAHG